MTTFNDTILRAYNGEKTDYTPLWFMRQAGRSQPEYLKLKEKYSLFEITHQPELCAYVTELPVQNYNTDAAILYKDIMSPLPPMGVDVEIKSGIGPVIDDPIRTMQDIQSLRPINPEEDLHYVMDTIRILTKEKLSVPLIGFSGAPFTLASYMIEGGPSKQYNKTKAMMYSEPKMWFALMDKLGDMVIDYTKAQVNAGAKAIQIFDSWVGAVNAQDYRVFIRPVMERIFEALKQEGIPTILFGIGSRHLLNEFNELPVSTIGLDWRTSIQEAREMGIDKTLQGNLDPAFLLADWETIETRTKEILDQGMNQSGGYVFNLGHGVFPEVKPETLKRLASFIHEYTRS
ncbi:MULTISPECIES: uroporphyrinogen decarboxylase [Allobacillus]|uniref:Uroporphyrinogen decarboxylase n=1 Tax=Allobacillus halotolerans TaxID=570278 RepID=A0ABS6GT71_9BACI|nr:MULTISPECIES: uroporphyrinogen decarboxylase [Allobacillus]MBU6081653.1 uroporphyrinogen decarboxylase [Allobacillus halotolerans]TSJ66358.1 uroporphyrinogen decarboxylase [Allobacillus sp. SKP2-8]